MPYPPMTRRLPAPLAESYAWQERGACRNPRHGQLWFSPETERGLDRRRRELAAKAVCMSCPVLSSCRSHALTVREPYGVWGGLSEQDRHPRKRR